MNRQLMQQLKIWQASPYRKPLLLMGSRQVGKTTLLHHLGGQSYQNVVSINFEDRPDLKRLFEPNLDPARIIRDISLELDVEIKPLKTLLIFDEIQEAPGALNSLKYFNENANEYHVCGAGSLLGVKLAHTKGFPVGKVHFETLYPLNFIEFLEAVGKGRLKNYLLSVELNEHISQPIHDQILQYLKCYLFIGGMPEAVNIYHKTQDLMAARDIHRDIIRAYDLDFTKHASSALIIKITECFHSIASQLAKENKKFIYSIIRKGARARSYEEAIHWLVEAGLFYKVSNVSIPRLPLMAYKLPHIFKIYPMDVGLLNTMTNLSPKITLQGNALFKEFYGSLMESFVAQELIQQSKQLYYWSSDGRAEVDFLLQGNTSVYPLEVKAGYSKQKKSLLLYGSKYHPKLLLRTSPHNLYQQDGFVNLPLYLVGQLTRWLENLH